MIQHARPRLRNAAASVGRSPYRKGDANYFGPRTRTPKVRLKGYDTELTEKTLEVFEDRLRAMYQHRDLIIRIIDQID